MNGWFADVKIQPMTNKPNIILFITDQQQKEITEPVIDADRFEGEERHEHLVSRIKEMEAAFQAKYN